MKPQKCCCGCCSLSSAAVVAAIICAIECAIGLFWNAQLWMHLDGKEPLLDFFPRFLKVSTLNDYNVVHGLLLASTVLHAVWLILCAMVTRANIALYRGVLILWSLFVDVQTCFDVGTTIYFAVKIQSNSPSLEMFTFYDSKNEPTASLSYVTLLVLFSRGIIFWIINLYFAHIVQTRAKEIQYNNSLLALYILSHLSPSRQDQIGERVRLINQGELPPNYCNPNYLPKYLVPGCRESLESSWSLNNEVLEGLNSYSNPLYPRIDQHSVSDLGQRVTTPPPPPYGQVVEVEQSYRHEGRGVLPY